MTANNPATEEISVSHTLGLLEQLAASAREHAEAAGQVLKESRTRRLGWERRQAEATAAFEQQVTQEAEALDRKWVARWDSVRQHHERRQIRLEKAERNSHRDMPRRIEAARAQWLGGLQRQSIARERSLAHDAARVLQEYENRKTRILNLLQELTRMERRATQAFQGSPGFGQFLKIPASDSDPGAGKGPGESLPEAWKTPELESGSIPGEATAVDPVINQGLSALEAQLPGLEERLAQYRAMAMPRLFSILTPPVLLLLVAIGGVVLAGSFGFVPSAVRLSAMAAGAALVMLVVLYLATMKAARPSAQQLAREVTDALQRCRRIQSAAQQEYDVEQNRFKAAQEQIAGETQAKWGGVAEVDAGFAARAKTKIATQVPRIARRNEERMNARRRELELAHSEESGAAERLFAQRREALTERQAAEQAQWTETDAKAWESLERTWQQTVPVLWEKLMAIQAAGRDLAPAWPDLTEAAWKPAAGVLEAMPFAHLRVNLEEHAGQIPHTPRLPLPGPQEFTLPLILDFPEQASLLLQTESSAEGPAAAVLNNIILRLLAASKPGKASFTIIDPVGLGQNFGGLMHLSDYEESLINHRIWTQRDQIDDRLGILTAHIEKVIQMYLRNEFETITEYNRQAGVVAEKYHFLVIADFPANFSEAAVKRLESILSSGPRCGVFTYLHSDLRTLPPELAATIGAGANRVALRWVQGQWQLPDLPPQGLHVLPEAPPSPAHVLPLLHRIGEASIDAGRVEVPFSQIAPAPEEYWTGDNTQELRIAIGRTGAVKHQMLAIGKGTRQHALFAGKTGSGKSTLFHVIITNLALKCSPDQVEFYLIDFKKGVEFKCYANKKLPHARVVAIESDREFALSVLHRLDEELKHRGDRFRELNVQDLAGYARSGATAPMPRTLLLIDEFQEFFTEDDPIAQTASLLLDRIVRQGRAFGIHVLLGSQTLGGAYSLARATLGQMSIRVALQCNEADAYLIMDDNNPAPRLLSRPGEGIYNDAAGSVEGNSPFQVVWLPDDERDRLLDQIHALAVQSGKAQMAPVVFEGNAPADLTDNLLLRRVLETPPASVPPAGRCWLGAPNAIKGPTEAAFHRQSGQHLLVVGQREEASLNLLGLALLALAAQYPAGSALFYFFHSTAPGTPEAEFVDQVAAAIPALVQVRPHEAPAVIASLQTQCRERASGDEHGPEIYAVIHGLHRFKKLRQEDDFSFSLDTESAASAGSQFTELISEGSSHGIHLLVSLDTFNNVNRSLSRKSLTEFEMRVVFQMSVNDSSSLIDSPAAGNLGLHRALFYNEHAGSLETFRPYAVPPGDWLEKTARILRHRHPAAGQPDPAPAIS